MINELPKKVGYHVIFGFFSLGVAFFILFSTFSGLWFLTEYEVILFALIVIGNFITAGWNFSVVVERYMRFLILLKEEKKL